MLVENGAVLKATQVKQIARRHPDKKKILEILKGMGVVPENKMRAKS